MFKLNNPDIYHGHKKAINFFEGWYFKIVSLQKNFSMAIIPGISKGNALNSGFSFIQVLIGSIPKSYCIRYNLDSFSYDLKDFNISVDKNNFSFKSICLNIHTEELHLQGKLLIKKVIKWPSSLLSPGSMGYYNFIPKMECYSQVCVMDGEVSGTIVLNGEEIHCNDSVIYVEKNWGESFPLGWVWLQCNCFNNFKGTSLSCSIARIPIRITSFRGFLIGFCHEGTFYKFTTMNHSKLTMNRQKTQYTIEVKNKHNILSLTFTAPPSSFSKLYGPKNGTMIPLVDESLCGDIKLCLYTADGKLIFSSNGNHAGIEFGGDYNELSD